MRKTIWDFKQRLEAEGREGSRKLFEAFNLQLEARGYIAREGSIIDASFTEATHQRNSREQNQRIKEGGRPEEFDTNPAVSRQKDSEARWTKKNSEAHYGWKNHVKADLKTKLIIKATTTPAHVHDSQVFEELLVRKTKPCSPTQPITARSTKHTSSSTTPRSSSCAKPRAATR